MWVNEDARSWDTHIMVHATFRFCLSSICHISYNVPQWIPQQSLTMQITVHYHIISKMQLRLHGLGIRGMLRGGGGGGGGCKTRTLCCTNVLMSIHLLLIQSTTYLGTISHMAMPKADE